MSEQDTIEMLEKMEKRRIEKKKKCIYCKKEFSMRVLAEEILVCPHCACVQMSRLNPLRLKHGFLFQQDHPAHPSYQKRKAKLLSDPHYKPIFYI